MIHITKQFKFCAAHQYGNPNWSDDENYEVFGKDIRLHGHNYILDVTVTGKIDTESGFIANLDELKEIVERNVIDIIDHSTINKDIEWFAGKQPSSENMVIWIWEQIETKLKDVRLYRIKLQETPTIYTEYFGPDE